MFLTLPIIVILGCVGNTGSRQISITDNKNEQYTYNSSQ